MEFTKREDGRYDVDDKEVDEIYDTLSNLQVDVDDKIEELKKELPALRDAEKEAEQAYWSAEDDEVDEDDLSPAEANKISKEMDELEEKYYEASKQVEALEDLIDNLEDLSDRLNNRLG